METYTTVFAEILAFILGRKYYANIINTRGTAKCELSCYIFNSRKQADNHRDSLASNRSFQFVQTVTFRSRKEYASTFNPTAL